MTTETSARHEEVAPPRFDGTADDLAAVIFGSIDQGREYAKKCAALLTD